MSSAPTHPDRPASPAQVLRASVVGGGELKQRMVGGVRGLCRGDRPLRPPFHDARLGVIDRLL